MSNFEVLNVTYSQYHDLQVALWNTIIVIIIIVSMRYDYYYHHLINL